MPCKLREKGGIALQTRPLEHGHMDAAWTPQILLQEAQAGGAGSYGTPERDGDMQETEPPLQVGGDLKKELDVLPSWGKTGQLVIAQFRDPGWRTPVTSTIFYTQANLSTCCTD